MSFLRLPDMWAKPILYYKHSLSGLVATSEVTGFEASKLLDRMESTWWKATSTADQFIAFDAGAGNTISADYFGVANHNLSGINVELQCSNTNYLQEEVFNKFLFGDFEAPIVMTPTNATLASVAGGETGNCLEITNSGAAAGSANQIASGLTVGKYYRFNAYFKKGTGASGFIKVGTTTDDDAYGSHLGLTDAGWTAYSIEFKATETDARVTFSNESTTAGHTALFDTTTIYVLDLLSVVDFSPSDNLSFIKEFTSQDKRYWRIKLSDLSVTPYIAMAYWGEKTELDYLTASFDPHAEEEEANINESGTGVLLGVHIKHTKREIPVSLSDSGDTLYQKVKAWKDDVGLLNSIIAWNKIDYPSDVWVMRLKPKSFKAPFVKGGLYRNISFTLIGRKEGGS